MTSIEFKSIEEQVLYKIFGKSAENYATNKFSVNDIYAEYKNKILIGEFKFRTFNHLVFENEWWMEKSKLENLITIANKQTTKKQVLIYYINFFTDGFLAVWDVTNIKPIYYTRMMYETTSSDFKNSGNKIAKSVFDLKICDAILLKSF